MVIETTKAIFNFFANLTRKLVSIIVTDANNNLITEKTQEFLGQPSTSAYNSPLIIDTYEYDYVVTKLRSFFKSKGFLEAHPQNRLSILAACEDPWTVASFDYAGSVWPLPQTGQMWLEYELLKNPGVAGFFCQSTSYRQEPDPTPGRHDLIFPLFEFEMHGEWRI
jgi:hypothetical protein